MHRRKTLLVLALAAAGLGACHDLDNPVLAPAEPEANLTPTSSLASMLDSAPSHLVVFKRSRGIPADFQASVERLGGTLNGSLAPLGLAIVDGLDAEGAREIGRRSDVASIDRDPQVEFRFESDEPLPEGFPSPQSAADPSTAAGFARQWNMRAIRADAAWAAGHLGSSEVTVAILDTGIDYMLPDLAGRVDLERSVSFVPADDFWLTTIFGDGWHPIADLDGHGTNVASQVSSNALYYAGVTSGSTLIGVKVCSFLGGCSFSAISQGIMHAVDNGANVINMSLGGYFSKRTCNGCTAIVKRLLDYAWRADVTVVVSAGNAAADLDHDADSYKTYCSTPNVICVSATGAISSGPSGVGPFVDVDAPAYYTNFGTSAINVAAPGGNAEQVEEGEVGGVSWIYSLCPRTKMIVDDEGTIYWSSCSFFPRNLYRSGYRGTSQAAPHVSGLAALLYANGLSKPADIRARLQDSADDLGAAGADPYYGRGRINVARAVGVN